jgi:hypothetical protein
MLSIVGNVFINVDVLIACNVIDLCHNARSVAKLHDNTT